MNWKEFTNFVGGCINLVTVQPFISSIHKPASKLSVAALQLMFTHFRNERLFCHKKVLNNTMNKLIVLPIIFLWLNCYIFSVKLCYSYFYAMIKKDLRLI